MNTHAMPSAHSASRRPSLRWVSYLENRVAKHALFVDDRLFGFLAPDPAANGGWGAIITHGAQTWHHDFTAAVDHLEGCARVEQILRRTVA